MTAYYDNWMIKASAGSGKTYSLVSRYIRLLYKFREPAQIMALTFTRKAAGEFLESILERLLEAATDAEKAQKLNEDAQLPNLGQADYEQLLRLVIREIGNLNLSTIDSFFARLVNSFPYELGLNGPPRMLESHEDAYALQAALSGVFSARSAEEARMLLELYKSATYGSEEKTVFRTFSKRIDALYTLYCEDRNPLLWGDIARIFGSSPQWASAPENIHACLGELEDLLDASGFPSGVERSLRKFVDSLSEWNPGDDFKANALGGRLLEDYNLLGSEPVTMRFGKQSAMLEGRLAWLVKDFIDYLIRGEIVVSLQRTNALGQLMQRFDTVYTDVMKESQGLVFADLPRLLIDHISQDLDDFGSSKLVYRLDMRIDHWLLDEFQDTSRLQWKVLKQFIDEVLQAGSEERSLYYVGDVKQSIYGWRGGDSRLFDEIKDHYGEAIDQNDLNISYRSCQAVIDYVNSIFKDISGVRSLEQVVAERWKRHFNEHKVADFLEGISGFSGYLQVGADEDLDAGCVELIRELAPVQRGLTCAVLALSNDSVKSITAALRAAGIPASMDGESPIATDNVLGIWILSHLAEMCRAGELLPKGIAETIARSCGCELSPATRRAVRLALGQKAYATATRLLLHAFLQTVLVDEFLHLRAFQLIEAAQQFESGSIQSLEAFVQFLMEKKVRERSNSGMVQVMTVHKSKGLDFDIVVAAGFGKQRLVRSNHQKMLKKRNDRANLEWLIQQSGKTSVALCPELSEQVAAENYASKFERICLLYVALTRAKRGLYVIGSNPNGEVTDTTWLDLMESGSSYAADKKQSELPSFKVLQWQQANGRFDWWANEQPSAAQVETKYSVRPMNTIGIPVPVALRRRPSPSGVAHQRQTFSDAIPGAAGKQFGLRMHAFLARIEWIDFADPKQIEQVIERAPEELRERLVRFFEEPLAVEVFKRRTGTVEVWRERPYAMRKDGFFTNGIIDRAVIERDAQGRLLHADIYDFKTDHLDPNRSAEEQLLEKYAAQIELYREAVGALEEVDTQRIAARLVPV
jgi:ATP-dependent exoDNAse (exonuclease V) beta subunit